MKEIEVDIVVQIDMDTDEFINKLTAFIESINGVYAGGIEEIKEL
jgi:hypothetical protein